MIYATAGQRAPSCDASDLAEGLKKILESVTNMVKHDMVKKHAEVYVKAAPEYRQAQVGLTNTLGGGEVSRGHDEWRRAETALADQRAKTQDFERSLKDATAKYEAAIKAQQEAGTSENQDRVKKAAAALRDALTQAGKASDFVGVPALSESRVQAIDTVLTALSGGQSTTRRCRTPTCSAPRSSPGTFRRSSARSTCSSSRAERRR